MPAIIEGFSEVLGLLKELASGVKAIANIPDNERKVMNDAIADTAELVDETLTILKQHLTTVVSELRFGDKQSAKRMIYELGDFRGWEDKYRRFQLCESLHEAVHNLDKKGVYKIVNNLAFNDPGVIHQRLFDYIGGETNAAQSVGTMLQDLSQLANSVDSDPEMVARSLEEARTEVGKWRQAFINLELEIRSSI